MPVRRPRGSPWTHSWTPSLNPGSPESGKISTRATKRPELEAAVKLAGEIRSSGVAVTLVVHEHKRLGRGIELAMLAEELKASDVGLEFLAGELKGSHDPSGIVFTVLAAMSGMEREYIRDRTLEGHESARKRGKANGGAGVTDESMLSMALHLRDQEMSLRDIAKLLERFVPRRATVIWAALTVPVLVAGLPYNGGRRHDIRPAPAGPDAPHRRRGGDPRIRDHVTAPILTPGSGRPKSSWCPPAHVQFLDLETASSASLYVPSRRAAGARYSLRTPRPAAPGPAGGRLRRGPREVIAAPQERARPTSAAR